MPPRPMPRNVPDAIVDATELLGEAQRQVAEYERREAEEHARETPRMPHIQSCLVNLRYWREQREWQARRLRILDGLRREIARNDELREQQNATIKRTPGKPRKRSRHVITE